MAKANKPVIPTGPGLCRLCPRWEQAKVVCMGGFGPTQPELVVIAESPAKVEDIWCRICQRESVSLCVQRGHQIGQPLVGRSGQLLRQALAEAGIDHTKVYYTNTVRCSGGNPTMIQIRKCRGYLLDELATIDWSRCRGVMILGQLALQGVMNQGLLRIRDARGRVLDSHGPLAAPRIDEEEAGNADVPGRESGPHGGAGAGDPRDPPVAQRRPTQEVADGPQSPQSASRELDPEPDRDLLLPRRGGRAAPPPDHRRLIPVPLRVTYHPSAVLRGGPYYDEIVTDFRNLWKARDDVKPVRMVSSLEELDALFPGVEIGLDLEWSGDGQIRMGGLSDGTQNAVTLDPAVLTAWLARKSQSPRA